MYTLENERTTESRSASLSEEMIYPTATNIIFNTKYQAKHGQRKRIPTNTFAQLMSRDLYISQENKEGEILNEIFINYTIIEGTPYINTQRWKITNLNHSNTH